MNLFENLQTMKESVNDEFVKQECEKYGFNKPSYGSGYMELYLEPSDKSAEEFIKKIEADGYKFIEEQKDGLKNTTSENDVSLVYGKEVGENRCIIAVVIHPSEDYVIATCGYNEDESDNEFFENLQTLKESNFDKDLIIDMVKDGFETGHPHIDYDEFSQDEEIGDIDAAWEFYNKLINLGPAGFYEEFADTLEFDPSFVAEYGDEEDLEESIIKDEKDMEQIVESTEIITEDSDNILDLVEAKSKRFGHMVDALGEEMPTSEINDFLKGLTTELDMDVYEGDKPYPTDLAGYFGQPVDELDINNSDDLEMINWIDGILTACIDKTNDFINSRIETLRGEISAIEGDIARLEMVL